MKNEGYKDSNLVAPVSGESGVLSPTCSASTLHGMLNDKIAACMVMNITLQPSLLYVLIVGKDHDGPGVGSVQELFDNSIKVNGPVFALLGDSHGLGNAEPTCLRRESRMSSMVP